MLPYYAAASALVVGTLVIFASGLGRSPKLRVASVPVHGTPSPARGEAASTFAPGSVTGEAPWALSAVPECFRQESEAHGSPAFVASRLPAGAQRLAAGTRLAVGDCRLRVGAAVLTLERGGERLVVPRWTRVYSAGALLAVLRDSGGSADLRVYRRVSAGGP